MYEMNNIVNTIRHSSTEKHVNICKIFLRRGSLEIFMSSARVRCTVICYALTRHDYI